MTVSVRGEPDIGDVDEEPRPLARCRRRDAQPTEAYEGTGVAGLGHSRCASGVDGEDGGGRSLRARLYCTDRREGSELEGMDLRKGKMSSRGGCHGLCWMRR